MLRTLKLMLACFVAAGALGAAECRALTVDLETGVVGAAYNDVQVPDNIGTRFSLTDDFSVDSKVFYRLRLTREVSKNNFISVLYAPLALDASGTTKGQVSFNKDAFPANTSITAKYRFDSYRVSYWRNFEKSSALNMKIGFTAKIRDAAISVSGNGITSEKKNTGFVPLLNLGLTYALNERFSAVFDADALAGGPGRAEDVLIAGQYNACDKCAVKLGYRVVEGGADVDEVYNFAQLDYWILGFIYSF